MWEQLGALKESGVTIIMSTHYMIEAETLCDRLAIMDHGNILDIGEPDEVVRHHVGAEVAMLQIGESATREERAALQPSIGRRRTRLQRGRTADIGDGATRHETGCLYIDRHR